MSTKKIMPKAIFLAKTAKDVKLLTKAEDMANFIFELENIRRKYLKYGDYSEEVFETLENVFDDIRGALDSNKIIIDDLIE